MLQCMLADALYLEAFGKIYLTASWSLQASFIIHIWEFMLLQPFRGIPAPYFSILLFPLARLWSEIWYREKACDEISIANKGSNKTDLHKRSCVWGRHCKCGTRSLSWQWEMVFPSYKRFAFLFTYFQTENHKPRRQIWCLEHSPGTCKTKDISHIF